LAFAIIKNPSPGLLLGKMLAVIIGINASAQTSTAMLRPRPWQLHIARV